MTYLWALEPRFIPVEAQSVQFWPWANLAAMMRWIDKENKRLIAIFNCEHREWKKFHPDCATKNRKIIVDDFIS